MRRSIFLMLSATLAIALGLIFRPEFFDLVSLVSTLGGALAVTWLSYSQAQLIDLWFALRELYGVPFVLPRITTASCSASATYIACRAFVAWRIRSTM